MYGEVAEFLRNVASNKKKWKKKMLIALRYFY